MDGTSAALIRQSENASDPKYQRSCAGKVQYLSAAEAAKQAKAMHKKYKKPFQAYSCKFCHNFHVGTQRSPEAAFRRDLKRHPQS